MPIEGKIEQPQAFVIRRSSKEICENRCLVASSLHGGEAGHRNGVEPWEHVGWEKLVQEHASKGIPKVSERFGGLDLLPMKTLESFDCRKSTPVDRIDVPDSNGSHNPSDAIAE